MKKETNSPLSYFNNFLLTITQEMYNMYFPESNSKVISSCYNLYNCPEEVIFNLKSNFNNQLIFQNKSMTIFMFIKFEQINNEILVSFNGKLNETQLALTEKTIGNISRLKQIFTMYLYYLNAIGKNLDLCVSENFINDVNKSLQDGTGLNKTFIIPHKDKIESSFDTKNQLLDKYSYGISFHYLNKKYHYVINKLVSSKLNESKTIENIRLEDSINIYNGVITHDKLNDFLVQLFYYGNII